MNNIFNLKRFGKLAKLQLAFGWRKMAIVCAGYVAAISAIYVLNNMGVIFRTENSYSSIDTAQTFLIMSFIAISIFVLLVSFKPYFRRGSAASQMMIPATRLEKFSLTALYGVVAAPIVFFILMALTDMFWIWIIEMASGGDIYAAVDGINITDGIANMFVHSIKEAFHDNDIYAFFSLFVMEVLLLLLCATLYRKNTVLLSVISIVTVHAIVIIAIQAIVSNVLLQSHSYVIFDADAAAALSNIISAALVYLSWRRFSRLQINK